MLLVLASGRRAACARRAGAALALATAVGVAGCAGDDFDLRNHRRFVAPDDAYRFSYLRPPWRVMLDGTESDRGGDVQLVVESPFTSVEIPESDPGEEFFTYNLLIREVPGNPDRLARRDVQAVRDSNDTLIQDPEPFVTDAGDEGVALVARTFALPTRHRQSIYFPSATAGRTIHVRLLAFPLLDRGKDPESDRMLRTFTVGPFEP